jgi:sugar phosphate isomerase/epimerase
VAKAIGDRVLHFHIKDYVREKNMCVALGEGGVNNSEVLNVLRAAGFDGAVSLETEGDADFERCSRIIRKSKAYLDDII